MSTGDNGTWLGIQVAFSRIGIPGSTFQGLVFQRSYDLPCDAEPHENSKELHKYPLNPRSSSMGIHAKWSPLTLINPLIIAKKIKSSHFVTKHFY